MPTAYDNRFRFMTYSNKWDEAKAEEVFKKLYKMKIESYATNMKYVSQRLFTATFTSTQEKGAKCTSNMLEAPEVAR